MLISCRFPSYRFLFSGEWHSEATNIKKKEIRKCHWKNERLNWICRQGKGECFDLSLLCVKVLLYFECSWLKSIFKRFRWMLVDIRWLWTSQYERKRLQKNGLYYQNWHDNESRIQPLLNVFLILGVFLLFYTVIKAGLKNADNLSFSFAKE